MSKVDSKRPSRGAFPPYSVLRLGNVLALTAASFLAGCSTLEAMRRVDINFNYVADEAQRAAARPFRPSDPIPPKLAKLGYSEYQQIRFKNDNELWKNEGLPFAVGFFHLGYLFRDPVELHEFTATHEQGIRYLSGFFDFGTNTFADELPASLNYAGFRVAGLEENGASYHEVASFLGASYFRAIAYGLRYGTSARGIAINSGLSVPEEFPHFTEFWLGKPLGNAGDLVIYALLDGPSVTGAYEFVIKPGTETVMRVKARLFLRESVQSFGVAPLTSMFWRGENRRPRLADYRPEVHDADGLALLDAGAPPMWRPFDISEKTRLSYFSLGEVQGFGLMQRDRDFDHYQDLEAEYHRRPSVWVEALGDWGAGYVKLVELPAQGEFDDNIVAYWEPAVLPEKGDVVEYEYAIHWSADTAPSGGPVEKVVATRTGLDQSYPGTHVFVVEFGPSAPPVTPEDKPEAVAEIGLPSGLTDVQVVWNPYSNTWRVTLRARAVEDSDAAVELRCRLVFPDGHESEQWSYQWTPSHS